MMSQETELPIYRPKTVQEMRLRHEWVNLEGGRVCVRELTAADMIMISDAAQRPRQDPRGGVDPGTSMVQQIALSCFNGPGPEAARIWGNDQLPAIYLLKRWEWLKLIEAMERLGGVSDAEMRAMDDFLGVTPEPSRSSSKSGVSATSTG